MESMFSSTGTIHYELTNTTPPYKCVLQIDQGIADYYYSTIPKSERAKTQMHKAHISVVRKEMPMNLLEWGKYEGMEVGFQYEHFVRRDETYYWLDVFGLDLERIRTGLGLENRAYIRPMEEGSVYSKRFHITIGNVKQN
jgi:hypothetical protein